MARTRAHTKTFFFNRKIIIKNCLFAEVDKVGGEDEAEEPDVQRRDQFLEHGCINDLFTYLLYVFTHFWRIFELNLLWIFNGRHFYLILNISNYQSIFRLTQAYVRFLKKK